MNGPQKASKIFLCFLVLRLAVYCIQGGASAWLPLVDLLAKLIGFVGALEDRMDKGENEGVMGGFSWLKLKGSARQQGLEDKV